MVDSIKTKKEKREESNKKAKEYITRTIDNNNKLINELYTEIQAWKQAAGCRSPKILAARMAKLQPQNTNSDIQYTNEYYRFIEFCSIDLELEQNEILSYDIFELRKQSLIESLQGVKNSDWTDRDLVERFSAKDVMKFFIAEFNNGNNSNPMIQKLVKIYNEVYQ